MPTRVQAATSQAVGVVGGVVYFSPPLPNLTTTYHQSHWYCGNSLKVAIHEYGKGVRYPNGPFKDRLELFRNNTLKISCLQKNDSNSYSMYLEDVAGKEYYYNVYLKVYDVVPKPTVRAIVNGDNPEHCDVTLECWVQLEDVTYEWMPPSRVMPVGSNSTNSTLPLSFNPSLETYTCRASNPVSSSSAQLTHRHPCLWTARVQAASSQVVGIVGGVVYLSPPPQTQKTTYHQSHWRCGSSLKVAIHENRSGVRYPNGPFKDRLELFPNNTLKIISLQKSDSNIYWVYLEDVAGTEHTYNISLKVYGEPGGVVVLAPLWGQCGL
ncbi:CD48 antigen [Aix galericulata]|nr:CD48 antigen [Aix galericulata]